MKVLVRILILLCGAIVALGFICFRRVYVINSGGLLDVKAKAHGSAVCVSGGLYSSGTKVIKVTTTRYGGTILVRVYGDRITDTESPRDANGTFRLCINIDKYSQAIAIGERPNRITIGDVCGYPVRLPRIPVKPSSESIIWTAK
jgi:hypothetical protein